MTLITLLIGLAIEYFLGALDKIRDYSWLNRYLTWLEAKCSQQRFWDGPLGLLLTMAIPLVIILAIVYLLSKLAALFTFLFAIFVFVYCMGPHVNAWLNQYALAIKNGDDAKARGIEEKLLFVKVTDHQNIPHELVLRSVFVRSHEHIFGVLFWFAALGVFGAALYALSVRLLWKFTDIHGGYADAVRDLHNILMWPSARLQALGFALAGSMMDAFSKWSEVKTNSLLASCDVLEAAACGAVQFEEIDRSDRQLCQQKYGDLLKDARDLINRTLIVWLIVLSVLTLGGWLA